LKRRGARFALSSLRQDEASARVAMAVLSADDPGTELDRLYPVLVQQKSLLATIGHLDQAGGDLASLTVSAAVFRDRWPVYDLLPELPEAVPGRIALSDLRAALMRHRDRTDEAVRIVASDRDLPTDGEPPFVLLYGHALALAYPEYSDRMHYDADLLVPDSGSGLRLLSALRSQHGFQLASCALAEVAGQWSMMFTAIRRDADGFLVHVDVVAGARPPVGAWIPPFAYPGVFRRARAVRSGASTVWIPSPEDMLLLAAERTLRKEPFPPNGFDDARAILTTEGDRLDWVYLRDAARASGLAGALHRIVTHVERADGATIAPPRVLADLAPGRLERRVIGRLERQATTHLTVHRAGHPALDAAGRRDLRTWQLIWFARTLVTERRWALVAHMLREAAFRLDFRLGRTARAPLARRLLSALRTGSGSLCELRPEPAPAWMEPCVSRMGRPRIGARGIPAGTLAVLGEATLALPGTGGAEGPASRRTDRGASAHRCALFHFAVSPSRASGRRAAAGAVVELAASGAAGT
jgi:Uncharacterised nucleotidyltransferase